MRQSAPPTVVHSLLLHAVLGCAVVGCRSTPAGQGSAAASGSAETSTIHVEAGSTDDCTIVVQAVADAQVRRGVRMTPDRRAGRARMDEKTRRDFRARDRSSRYLQCTHVVSINGKRYEYEHVVDSSFAPDSIADWEAKCRSAETKRRLVEHLRISTDYCKNLTGGEHWGLELRPVDAGDGQ